MKNHKEPSFIIKSLLFVYANLKILFIKLSKKDKKKNLIKIKTLNHKMYVREDDKGISKDLILRGIREPIATNFLLKKIKDKKNLTFLDIGANIGYYVLIELIYSKNSKVICFEPDPDNFKVLQQNLELNNFDRKRVIAKEMAIGNKNGEIIFYSNECCNAGSILPNNKAKKTTKVKIKKIDDLIKKKVNCMRMDVEGSELMIIKGAKKLLSGVNAPEILFIEIHPIGLKDTGSNINSFFEELKKLEYIPKKFIYQSSDVCSGKSKMAVYDNWKEFKKNPFYYKNACIVFFEKII